MTRALILTAILAARRRSAAMIPALSSDRKIKPEDVMDSKQKECKLDSENDKSPDPNSDPCSKEKKCGYDSCSFFYKSKGEKDCKQFVQSKKEYDAAKKAYEATPPTPPGPNAQKKQDMETKKKKEIGRA